MRILICFALIMIAVPACAEQAFFTVVKIESLQLYTGDDVFTLGENCTIKNKKGATVPLTDVKIPASAKGSFAWKGEQKELQWVVLTGVNNNKIVPE